MNCTLGIHEIDRLTKKCVNCGFEPYFSPCGENENKCNCNSSDECGYNALTIH